MTAALVAGLLAGLGIAVPIGPVGTDLPGAGYRPEFVRAGAPAALGGRQC
ncbi:MAG TPA: hypothetical protein VFE65_25355 [Pseudonocardia sp.]|nr:hypothetical protein [Pseudonocardia sp.]